MCVCRAFAVQVRRGEDGARWSCVSITLFRAILDWEAAVKFTLQLNRTINETTHFDSKFVH